MINSTLRSPFVAQSEAGWEEGGSEWEACPSGRNTHCSAWPSAFHRDGCGNQCACPAASRSRDGWRAWGSTAKWSVKLIPPWVGGGGAGAGFVTGCTWYRENSRWLAPRGWILVATTASTSWDPATCSAQCSAPRTQDLCSADGMLACSWGPKGSQAGSTPLAGGGAGTGWSPGPFPSGARVLSALPCWPQDVYQMFGFSQGSEVPAQGRCVGPKFKAEGAAGRLGSKREREILDSKLFRNSSRT